MWVVVLVSAFMLDNGVPVPWVDMEIGSKHRTQSACEAQLERIANSDRDIYYWDLDYPQSDVAIIMDVSKKESSILTCIKVS